MAPSSSSLWLEPRTLFKIAAGIHAVAAPGHVFLGFDSVYPALRTISTKTNDNKGKNKVGQRAAENCWNYVAVSLVIASLLHWQWSRTGGPRSSEELGIFFIINGMHAINGLRYAQVGCYEPLLPMWVAPILSLVAYANIK